MPAPRVLNQQAEPGRWWWLSFVDTTIPYREEDDCPGGPRHLGICIVFAPTFELAVGGSWVHDCNPGGQVAGYDFPLGTVVPPDRQHVLITGDEAHQAAEESERWVPAIDPVPE